MQSHKLNSYSMGKCLHTSIMFLQVNGGIGSANPNIHIKGSDVNESRSLIAYWVYCGASLLAGYSLLDFNREDQLIPVILHYGGVIIRSPDWNFLDDNLGDCNKIREALDTCPEFLCDIHITLCECTLENEAMVKCNKIGINRCIVHAHKNVWNSVDDITKYLSVCTSLNVECAIIFGKQHVSSYWWKSWEEIVEWCFINFIRHECN